MLKYFYIAYLLAAFIIFFVHRYKGYSGRATLLGLVIGGFIFPYLMVLFLAMAIAIVIWLPSKRAFLPREYRSIEPFKGKNDIVSSIMGISAIISKIDGKVDADEIKIIRTFVNRKFGFSSEEIDAYKGVFNFAKSNPYAIDDFTAVIRKTRNYGMIMELAYLFVAISFVDGEISSKEEALLKKIFVDIGLSVSIYESVKYHSFSRRSGAGRTEDYERDRTKSRPSVNRVKSYYEVLGLDEGASLKEIKRAYRKLAKKYHPDEMEASAVTSEYKDFAREQMNKINEAYDYLKEYKS